MVPRALAGLLVLVLVGPSVAAATCELTCAMASHHAPVPSSSPCHEHQDSSQGVGIAASPSALCHESADLPSAVIDVWLGGVGVAALPAAAAVIAPPFGGRPISRTARRGAPFYPRPAHRPLRV